MYSYLLFQLKTHVYLYDDIGKYDDNPAETEENESNQALGRYWGLGL